MTFGVLELDRNVNSAYQILGLGLAILTHKSDNGCRKINAYVVSLQLNDPRHRTEMSGSRNRSKPAGLGRSQKGIDVV